MAETVHFELVSPERLLMSIDAAGVVVPGAEGDFMVLPNHSPLLSNVRPGVITVNTVDGGEPKRLFVRAGFAEVTAEGVTILAEEAIAVEDLSKADLEQRVKDAQEDVEDAANDEAKRHAQENLARLKELLAAVS